MVRDALLWLLGTYTPLELMLLVVCALLLVALTTLALSCRNKSDRRPDGHMNEVKTRGYYK
ncbi:MAG: hypothetical protein AAGK74_02845 [Chloroflexota bacterium]